MAADFLMSHHMLLRGARRQMELPDMFTLAMPNEGATPCDPMIVLLDNGKTNTLGKREYIGVMRHRDPLLCTWPSTSSTAGRSA